MNVPKKKKEDYPSDANEGRTVFVRGLSLSTEKKDLHTAFAPFGTIDMALLVKSNEGQSKGSAFVKFSKKSEAKACITATKGNLGIQIGGRSCLVDLAVDREQADLLKNREKEKRDRRHLFLANEGLSLSAEETQNMAEGDKEKRKSAQAEKKKKAR